MNNLYQLDIDTFFNRLFQQSINDLRTILEPMLRMEFNTIRKHEIAVSWLRRMQWNDLPNVLWIASWNWLKQMDFRCRAIHLNRQCYQLSQSCHSCIPIQHVKLKTTVVEFNAKQICLDRRITCLSITLRDLFPLHSLLQLELYVHCSVVILIQQLHHTSQLQVLKLHINLNVCHALDTLAVDLQSQFQGLLPNLEEFELHGGTYFGTEFAWLQYLVSLPKLRRLHFNRVSFVNMAEFLQRVNPEIQSLHIVSSKFKFAPLNWLSRLAQLQSLILNDFNLVGDGHLTPLYSLSNLRTLKLNCTTVGYWSIMSQCAFTWRLEEAELDFQIDHKSPLALQTHFQILFTQCKCLRILSLQLHFNCIIDREDILEFAAAQHAINDPSIQSMSIQQVSLYTINHQKYHIAVINNMVSYFNQCNNLHTLQVIKTWNALDLSWTQQMKNCFYTYSRLEQLGGIFQNTQSRQHFFALLSSMK